MQREIAGLKGFNLTKTLETQIKKSENLTYHGDCIGRKQLLWREHREVGDVGEDVDDGHQGQRDPDGTRQVSMETTFNLSIISIYIK